MPEGPEIKREADKIAAAIAGKPTSEVFFAFPHLQQFNTRLTGERVTSVEARGKALLTAFSNGLTIYSHNQLYGKWMIVKAGRLPETSRQLRLAIHNEVKSALLYSASDIEVLTQEELGKHPFLRNLGPDILNENVTPAQVLERLQSKTFRRRRITALLLDQRFLAGLGNYLRSEVMFKAGINPQARPMDCSAEMLTALADAIVNLTVQSYQTAGITNDLARVEALKSMGHPRRNYRFYAFARKGLPCYDCGEKIVKIDAGSRRLYYCPSCQG